MQSPSTTVMPTTMGADGSGWRGRRHRRQPEVRAAGRERIFLRAQHPWALAERGGARPARTGAAPRSELAEAGSQPRTAQRVLFLCTHNSARSQMAEGLLRLLGGDRFEAFSAGTQATRVRPLAIRAMQELGVDISGQESKTLERYLDQPFDKVITVCDQANEACPVFFGARERLHWSFPDPSAATGTEDQQLIVYRAGTRRNSGAHRTRAARDGLEAPPTRGCSRFCTSIRTLGDP